MRTYFLILFIGCLFSSTLFAQDKVELKVNGSGLFFGSRTLALEYL
jgi:hypothetical protein